jgi:hypothetical protein
MRVQLATIFILTLTSLCHVPAVIADQDVPGKKAPRKNGKQTSLSGCIDEHEGQYVLIHDQTRVLIANLEAEGFPTEGFAKYLGHKVVVRGAPASGGERPVFRVRTVEKVSETCGPAQIRE